MLKEGKKRYFKEHIVHKLTKAHISLLIQSTEVTKKLMNKQYFHLHEQIDSNHI